MIRFLRTLFKTPERKLSIDELDFLKLIAMVGFLLTFDDKLKSDATAQKMDSKLYDMYIRRTRGVSSLDPDQPTED